MGWSETNFQKWELEPRQGAQARSTSQNTETQRKVKESNSGWLKLEVASAFLLLLPPVGQ